MDPAPAASAVAPCAREVVGAPRTLLDLLTPPWFLGLPTVERVRLLDARDPVALDHFGYTWRRFHAMLCPHEREQFIVRGSLVRKTRPHAVQVLSYRLHLTRYRRALSR